MDLWITGVTPADTGTPCHGGYIITHDRAAIPATDRSFLLGDGLFETLRIRDGTAPFLPRHLRRLREGCQLLELPFPTDVPFAEIIRTLCRRSELHDAYVRITCTRGPGGRGYAPPAVGDLQPIIVVAAGKRRPPDLPMAVCLSPWRESPHPLLSKVKHTSALSRILLSAHARRRSAQETLQINAQGHLVEGTTSNLFWVADGQLYTPDAQCGCLPGIARGFVMAQQQTTTGNFSPLELRTASEVFLTNALHGIMPVAAVQDVGRWRAPGPVARQLRNAWEARFDTTDTS